MAKNVARGSKKKKGNDDEDANQAVDLEDEDAEDQTEGGESDDEEEDEDAEGQDGDEGDDDDDEEEEEEEEEEVTEVPDFFDEDEELVPLKKRDFPKTLDGKVGFCKYNIAKWKVKMQRVKASSDPKAKAKAKLDRYKKLIKKLEAEMEDDD